MKPSYRGKGLSRRIMQILLHHAGEQQIPLIRLETGPKQTESISLYENLGFHRCGPFGNILTARKVYLWNWDLISNCESYLSFVFVRLTLLLNNPCRSCGFL